MVQVAWIWIYIVLIQKCTFLNWKMKKKVKSSWIVVYFCIDKILLRFHEFSGVVTSTRFRIVSAKFDVIKKHRIMPANPKLNSRFCDIFTDDLLLFSFLMAQFSFIQLWFFAVNSLYYWQLFISTFKIPINAMAFPWNGRSTV